MAAQYRLTFRPSGNPKAGAADHKEPTDEWRKIRSIEEAEAKAARARKEVRHAAPMARKKQKPVPVDGTGTVPVSGPQKPNFPVPLSGTTVGPKTGTTIYISGGVGGRGTEEALGAKEEEEEVRTLGA
jgi:hypothetical protein